MWWGLETNIPTGWILCDGTGGTPDLRDRFIVNPPTYPQGSTGGAQGGAGTFTGDGHRHFMNAAPDDIGSFVGVSSWTGFEAGSGNLDFKNFRLKFYALCYIMYTG